MHRRQFLKSSCTTCFAIGSGIFVSGISSCATSVSVFKAPVIDNKITVPLSLFIQSNFKIIRSNALEYDIALKKESDVAFLALQMRCTHADNSLSATGTGFSCSLHGSLFDLAGNVTKGPAQLALRKYNTEILAGNIIINL